MSEIPMQSAARGTHALPADDYRAAQVDAPVGDEPLNGADYLDDPATDLDTADYPDPGAPPSFAADQVDLDSDPFADDLSAELAHAAPKRWADRATIVLAALALVVGGFLGGVQVEKHYGQSATSTAANRRAAFAGGFNRAGTGGGTGTGAGGTGAGATGATPTAAATQTGSIKLVDGTTVYVGLANGDVLTVRTTSATKVTVGTATKVSQLKAGQTVTVTGPTNSGGEVAATAITAGP